MIEFRFYFIIISFDCIYGKNQLSGAIELRRKKFRHKNASQILYYLPFFSPSRISVADTVLSSSMGSFTEYIRTFLRKVLTAMSRIEAHRSLAFSVSFNNVMSLRNLQQPALILTTSLQVADGSLLGGMNLPILYKKDSISLTWKRPLPETLLIGHALE